MRPLTRVIGISSIVGKSGNFWGIRRRKAACSHYEEATFVRLAAIGLDRSAQTYFIELRAYYLCVELDRCSQFESIGDLIYVPEDFRLSRVSLTPLPLLMQILGKCIGVFKTPDIASSSWISVPIPGSSDPVSPF